MQLWVMFQVKSEDGKQFEFGGVFDSEEKAIGACREPWDAISPCELNAVAPRESFVMPGAYYPLGENRLEEG